MSELDLNFVADRVADTDATLTLVINALQKASSFENLQQLLQENLKEVQITTAVDIDKWLADIDNGYVLVGRFEKNAPIDFYRDDEDALPFIFKTKTGAMITAEGNKFDVVRVRDLAEEYEKRNS